MLPNGAPRGKAARTNTDWQLVLKVANNDAVLMKPGATLEILQAVHLDPNNYDIEADARQQPRLKARLIKPHSEERKLIRKWTDIYSISDTTEALNIVRDRNGKKPVDECTVRRETARMGSKTVRTPTD